MTVTKLKDGSFYCTRNGDILFNVETEDEMVSLLIKWLEVPQQEVEDALMSMINNKHNTIEFGELNAKFIFSKYTEDKLEA